MTTEQLAKELQKVNRKWSDAKAGWAASFYRGSCNAAMIEWLYGKRFVNQLIKQR